MLLCPPLRLSPQVCSEAAAPRDRARPRRLFQPGLRFVPARPPPATPFPQHPLASWVVVGEGGGRQDLRPSNTWCWRGGDATGTPRRWGRW